MNEKIDHMNLVKRLTRLDTCAVSDALDKLGMTGAVCGLPPRAATHRIAGRVRTMKLGIGKPPSGTQSHLGVDIIEAADPNDVIVIEQRTGLDAACWGGTLSLAAKLKKLAGVIAEGPVRDIDQAEEYGFPIFARALTARTARGRIRQLATDCDILVGDVCVYAGDYAIADKSAVVFIPSRCIEEVLVTAETITQREAAMAKELLNGSPVSKVMGADYEQMLKK